MKNEKIKQKIIEHICDGIILDNKIHHQIESSKELKEYYHEMKIIFNQDLDENTKLPDNDYWDNCWNELEPKLTVEKTPIYQLFESSAFRYATVAIIFVVFGFLAGNYWPDKPTENNQFVLQQKQLTSLFSKTRTLITSFVSMDEYSSYELLDPNIEISKRLLSQTEELRIEFQDDPEVEELLSEIQKILTMISALKNKSAASIKMTQFGIENKEVISQINQIEI